MLGDAGELRSTLEPTIEGLGYELVYVTLVEAKHRFLRMFIDAPGGITLSDCEQVSRKISDILDVDNLIEGEYTLEVSSPGFDRPLAKLEHFQNSIGKEIQIRMQGLNQGRRKFRGVLTEVSEAGATIKCDAQLYNLFFSEMHKANLVSVDPTGERHERHKEKNNG